MRVDLYPHPETDRYDTPAKIGGVQFRDADGDSYTVNPQDVVYARSEDATLTVEFRQAATGVRLVVPCGDAKIAQAIVEAIGARQLS